MEVGQTIYVEPRNNAARYSKEIETHIVSKVGRKYFELEGMYNARFFIKTLSQDGGQYCSDHQGYLSLKEIEDKREADKLYNEVRKYFSTHSTKLSLENLKQISDILNCD